MPDGTQGVALGGRLTAVDVATVPFMDWAMHHHLSPDLVRLAIAQGLLRWGVQLVAHQWHRMTRFNAWPVCGEWEVSQSHFQWVAGLPDEWRRVYDAELAQASGMGWVSDADCRAHAMRLSWSVGDITGTIQSVSLVQSLLQWASSTMAVQMGVYGDDPELVMGWGRRVEKGGVMVSICEDEWVRTPTMRVAVPASISDGHVLLRSAAISAIYDIKWSRPPALPDSFRSVDKGGYWLRERVWHHGAGDRSILLPDMTALILAHEWGHVRVHHQILPIKMATFAEAVCGRVPEVAVLLEWWAELVPPDGTVSWEGPLAELLGFNGMVNGGALASLCDGGSVLGCRRFWMYWSDTWFFDTPHRHMDAYSWGMACLFALAIVPQPGRVSWSDALWGDGLYTPFVAWAWDALFTLQTWVLSQVGVSLESRLIDQSYASYRQAWDAILRELPNDREWQGPRPHLGVIHDDWCRRVQAHWPVMNGPDDVLALVERVMGGGFLPPPQPSPKGRE